MKRALFFIILVILTASAGHAADGQIRDPATGMELVFVKGGCFEMGTDERGLHNDSGPIHTVCVDDSYMGKYEVTQKQWTTVMGDNPSSFKQGGDYPVEHITFVEAQAFVKSLRDLTGKPYRLPTEAEWEYAARGGGKKTRYAGTSSDRDIHKYAWYEPNSGAKTHPVGQKMPNGLGLYDMSGNVWEWVSDWHDANYYRVSPRDNPQGPDKGMRRVLRGGSWFSDKHYVHVSNRGGAGESARYVGICGLRILLPAE